MREGEVLHDLQPGEEAEQGHDVGRRAHPEEGCGGSLRWALKCKREPGIEQQDVFKHVFSSRIDAP